MVSNVNTKVQSDETSVAADSFRCRRPGLREREV